MTDETIRFEIPQDDLVKMALDGDAINMTTAHDDPEDRKTVVIEIDEVDGLFRDKEILQRIKHIANTQTVEQ